MSSYFSLYKHRQDSSFQPPSPPPSIAGSNRNPNPFDPNLYVSSPSTATPPTFAESHRKDQHSSNSMDFTEELAALMKTNGSASTPNPTSNFDDYSRHPPHNIFDVSAPPPPSSAHHSHFPHPFSIPIPPASQFRPGSSHHGPDSPFTATSPYSAHSESGFTHHIPLPSPLPPLNINGHHPPGPDELSHSPFVHHPPPLPMSASGRPPSPFADSRSRSRSKPPMSAGGLPNPARSRMSKKRASMSGIERPHPSAIMIPGNNSRPNTSSGSAPLSAHAMGWPAFSLPTPDSLSTHAFGSFGDKPPIQAAKKEEEATELDPVSKQSVAALANEKRRRRRESHNAVERRRRDNINEKISELATLIPECLLDPAVNASGTPANSNNKEMGMEVFTTMGSVAGDDDSKEPPAIKANKGMILRKSVDYIRYLQQLVTAQANRNRDLEAQVQSLQARGVAGGSSSISSPHSSDSAPELVPHGQTHNFHVFGDELIGGLNGMGMVDILHSLGPDEGEVYMSGQYGGTGARKSPQAQRFEGLETLHEHEQNGDTRHVYDDMDNDNEGEMELDDTSPSASADSPEEPQVAEKEELERGRARIRPQMQDSIEAEEVAVKKESPLDS